MDSMSATIIDGGAIAAELLMSLREDIMRSEQGAPGLATVLVGDGHGHEIGDWVDHHTLDLLEFLTETALKEAA